jgi:hypothetical protein
LEKLNLSTELVLSSKALGDKLGIQNARILHPFVNADDFPMIKSSFFKHDFFAVATDGLTIKKAFEIFQFFTQKNLRFCFIGPDDHLGRLKKVNSSLFLGEKCNGDLAPLLASARALVHCGEEVFPLKAVYSFLVGRPVYCLDNPFYREYIPDAIFISDLSQLLAEPVWDAQKNRAHGLKFHPLKFRAQFFKIFEGMKYVEKNPASPCC